MERLSEIEKERKAMFFELDHNPKFAALDAAQRKIEARIVE